MEILFFSLQLYFPFQAYQEHKTHFVSEFGFQSLLSLETVRTFALEPEWK